MKKRLFYTIIYVSLLHFCHLSVVFASSNAKYQSLNRTEIDIEANDVTLKEVIDLLKENTDFKFFYLQSVINDTKRLRLTFGKPISELYSNR